MRAIDYAAALFSDFFSRFIFALYFATPMML